MAGMECIADLNGCRLLLACLGGCCPQFGAWNKATLLIPPPPSQPHPTCPAGPPASLTQGAAALPRGASKTAGHCTTARADAQAMAAAEELFATATGEAVRSEEALALEKQLLRCLLKEIILASKVRSARGWMRWLYSTWGALPHVVC